MRTLDQYQQYKDVSNDIRAKSTVTCFTLEALLNKPSPLTLHNPDSFAQNLSGLANITHAHHRAVVVETSSMSQARTNSSNFINNRHEAGHIQKL